jgi:hypothetical protein
VLFLEVTRLINTKYGDYCQSKLETSRDAQHSIFGHYCKEALVTYIFKANHFSIEKIIRIAYSRGHVEQAVPLVFIGRKKQSCFE